MMGMDTNNTTIPEQQTSKPRIKVRLPIQHGLDTETHVSSIPTTTPTTITTTESAQIPAIPTTSKSTSRTVNLDSVEVMPEDQFKRCEALIQELKKQKYKGLYWPFLNPVDADAWGASDYYEIIKNPMDMATYERKLYEYEYTNEEELAEDIRLMFRNCYFYNPPHHLVHNLGKEFEEVFEKYWTKLHSNGSSKKSSKHHSSKRQRTSHTVDTSTSNITPTSTVQQQQQQQQQQPQQQQQQQPQKTQIPQTITTSSSSESLPKNDNSSSSIKINTNNNNNNNNQGRSTILRLKLNGPNVKKEEEKPKVIMIKVNNGQD